MENKLIAKSEGRLIKLESKKLAHYLPVAIIDNPNFKEFFKLRETNIIELYPGYMIIRPKTSDDNNE